MCFNILEKKYLEKFVDEIFYCSDFYDIFFGYVSEDLNKTYKQKWEKKLWVGT